mgnify:CR=1 FL=1
MQTVGYVIVENEKILLYASYRGEQTVLTYRESGKDGVHFTSFEELISKSNVAVDRLKRGKELIV